MNKFLLSSTLLMMAMMSLFACAHADEVAADSEVDLGDLVEDVDDKLADGSLVFGPHMFLVLAVGVIAAVL